MELDFPKNHCIFCAYFNLTPNDHPCKDCMEVGDIPGRDRPLFVHKDEKNIDTPIDSPKKNTILERKKMIQRKLF